MNSFTYNLSQLTCLSVSAEVKASHWDLLAAFPELIWQNPYRYHKASQALPTDYVQYSQAVDICCRLQKGTILLQGCN